MVFLTRWFGVTESDADRDPTREKADIEAIVEKSLLMQANAAAKQRRSLCRGTHAKGVCARAAFEVFDVTVGHEPALATPLAKGIFAKPGVYPAVVRFANADASINSDFKPDVRSLSFSVDLARESIAARDAKPLRQDFSMQNATTLPINDSPAFLATVSLLTASNPILSAWSLRFRDKLRVMRTLALAEIEAPFHMIARIHLLPRSRLDPEESATTYFDVTSNSTPDSTPVGSINRARWPAEVASRKARMPHAPAAGGAETLAPIEACPAVANEASIGGRQSGREEYRHDFGRKAQ